MIRPWIRQVVPNATRLASFAACAGIKSSNIYGSVVNSALIVNDVTMYPFCQVKNNSRFNFVFFQSIKWNIHTLYRLVTSNQYQRLLSNAGFHHSTDEGQSRYLITSILECGGGGFITRLTLNHFQSRGFTIITPVSRLREHAFTQFIYCFSLSSASTKTKL